MNKIKVYTAKITKLYDDLLFARGMEKVSDDRRARVERLAFRENKNQSLGAGLLLDLVLGKMGIKDPVICRDKHGKPFISDSDIGFSLSHSGEYVMCAAGYARVGCDIQKIREAERAIRCFCPEEREYIKIHGGDSRLIMRMWSLRESYVKAVGNGLAATEDFCIDISGAVPVLKSGGELSPCFFREFDIYDGYVCAACGDREIENITEIQIDEML